MRGRASWPRRRAAWQASWVFSVASGVLRQVAGPRRREALLDELRALVRQHLVEAGLEAVQGAPDDVLRAGLRSGEPAGEVGIDEGHVQRQHLRLLRRELVARGV